GPGMQEMLMPTSLIKAVGLASKCALVTDGRFSGASSGLSVGHVSPEAAEGGEIALVADGDEIAIDIPARTITLAVAEDELERRRVRAAARPLARGALPPRWRAAPPPAPPAPPPVGGEGAPPEARPPFERRPSRPNPVRGGGSEGGRSPPPRITVRVGLSIDP